ncbi:hypothetical protein ETH_00033595 [Eimeria tenella]|uniref:Uncharacterized protein n=1 Tax=Eimeria tenella TaxID=5802 RepID=U6KS49_EIMTE|nr:hypothetical protein ETH_00033595 [Eimeria tenella]CDJ40912.1 hypothetical protein ETH_00033595 [Eimeria tenella]|eukprot:XP_013231662.1 hypothetical protein ETH_00033595 [Eimeria tenella]
MLHDLLMALAGFPGDVFVRYEDLGPPEAPSVGRGGPGGASRGPPGGPLRPLVSGGGGFRLNPKLKGFSEGEREALERAVAPGYDLLLIREFIAAAEAATQSLLQQGGAPWGAPPGAPKGNAARLAAGGPFSGPSREAAAAAAASSSPPPAAAAAAAAGGLYTAALARASRELCEVYLSTLVAAEDELLQQQQTPLAALSLALKDQPHKMRVLRQILSQAWGMALSAAAAGAPLPCGVLMDFLWRGSSSGDPLARGVMGAPAAAAAAAEARAGAAAAAAAAAAGVVLFVGKAIRVLRRGGKWGQQQQQQVECLASQMRKAFSHPSSPAAVILPCLKALRAIVPKP